MELITVISIVISLMSIVISIATMVTVMVDNPPRNR